MSGKTYGAKCHLCAHLDHREYSVEPQPWLGTVTCPTCDECQAEALHNVISAHGGIDLFDAETRAAVRAFKVGNPHPIIARLRWECQALEVTVTVLGEEWKVADAQHDGQHVHLTLVPGPER